MKTLVAYGLGLLTVSKLLPLIFKGQNGNKAINLYPRILSKAHGREESFVKNDL